MKIELSLHTYSQEFNQLVWHEFAESRNRGISIEINFPILSRNRDKKVVLAHHNGVIVAGLVIAECQLNNLRYGKIGFVYVVKEYRGKGITKSLLKYTLDYLSKNNFRYATLWTTQPHIYKSSGFIILDTKVELTLKIRKIDSTNRKKDYKFQELTFIPVGAKSVRLYSFRDLESFVINYKDKNIIVPKSLINLSSLESLYANIPNPVISIDIKSEIYGKLKSQSLIDKVANPNLQMWYGIGAAIDINEITNICCNETILDRI